MRLVPRQLRRSTFPSSVPYYGGRLTPPVIQGLKAPPPLPPPPLPPPPVSDAQHTKMLAALQALDAGGVLTEQERTDIARRILEVR